MEEKKETYIRGININIETSDNIIDVAYLSDEGILKLMGNNKKFHDVILDLINNVNK